MRSEAVPFNSISMDIRKCVVPTLCSGYIDTSWRVSKQWWTLLTSSRVIYSEKLCFTEQRVCWFCREGDEPACPVCGEQIEQKRVCGL